MVKAAQWKSLAEVREDFRSADVVGRRTVFNIKGNRYRLVARINYERRLVFILGIVTHADYNKMEV